MLYLVVIALRCQLNSVLGFFMCHRNFVEKLWGKYALEVGTVPGLSGRLQVVSQPPPLTVL